MHKYTIGYSTRKKMNLIQELLNDTLIEADNQLIQKMRDAKGIIQSFSSAEVPYEDFLMRVMGYSNGKTKPAQNKHGMIDVIPVLDALASKGYVQKNSNGVYSRVGDVLGKLMSQTAQTAQSNAIDGNVTKQGKLNLAQTQQMGHLAGSGDLGDKLKNAPKNYKAGGVYSGNTKEAVLKVVKESDPAWKALSDSEKGMIDKLNQLSNPLYSFTVLKALMSLRGKKKGYASFAETVKTYFNDEEYITALMQLEDIGVVDDQAGTINGSAVRDIRNVMDFLETETVQKITPIDKVSAFLPKFMAGAVSTSATTHKNLNNIVLSMHPESKHKKAEFVRAYNIIQKRLTDDKLHEILQDDNSAAGSLPVRIIYKLAKTFGVDSVDELKNSIEEKFRNRMNYGGDENKEAKNTGRIEEFIKNFSI